VHTGSVGSPQNRTEVPGVFHSVKDQEERSLAALGRDLQNIFERSILSRGRAGDHSLVHRIRRFTVQYVPRRHPDLDTPLLCEPDDLNNIPVGFALLGDQQTLDGPA
jgi:hypothetical protein